ncbi:hypothetical protein [Aliikangiella sp. IMCC44632]
MKPIVTVFILAISFSVNAIDADWDFSQLQQNHQGKWIHSEGKAKVEIRDFSIKISIYTYFDNAGERKLLKFVSQSIIGEVKPNGRIVGVERIHHSDAEPIEVSGRYSSSETLEQLGEQKVRVKREIIILDNLVNIFALSRRTKANDT